MKPVLQALLLAERIYEDKHTGKKIITGIFNSVLFQRRRPDDANQEEDDDTHASVPEQHPGSPYVYINLTEVRGQMPLRLSYVDLSDGRELMACSITAQSDNPLSNVEIVVAMPMLPILHEGAYALELLSGEEMIGSLRILAEDIESVDEDGEHSD